MSGIVREVTIGECRLILGDCREVLPSLPKCDLILTDPPYGIGADTHAGKAENGWTQYGPGGWDIERPAPWLFGLMQEKANDCVIWGGNYFADLLPPSMRWLVWDKGQRNFSLADCEFAWTNQQLAARVLTLSRGEAMQDGKEHPTQKPLRLMLWCLDMHQKAATVCDPFMGSGTTGVACARMGKRFTGIEREPKYFEISCERIENAYRQAPMFPTAKQAAPHQNSLLEVTA